jgi:hypothetical protein
MCAHSLIIVYVHPEDLPAILALAGHEVVVGRVVGGGRSRLEAAGAPVVGGVAVGGRAVAAATAAAAPGQAVRAMGGIKDDISTLKIFIKNFNPHNKKFLGQIDFL